MDPTLYVRVYVLLESPYPDLHMAPLFFRRIISLLKLGVGAFILELICSGAGMDVSWMQHILLSKFNLSPTSHTAGLEQ